MKKAFLILFPLLVSVCIAASEIKIYFSGEFNNADFELFAQSVREQTGSLFFYEKSWVRSIKITVSGDSLELGEVLKPLLADKGLFYFIDKEKNVFITSKVRLVTELPDYSFVEDKQQDTVVTAGDMLTDIEKMYIEGRKTSTTKVITVGKQSINPDKRPVTLKGRVKDKETGEPLIGATVYIEELSE